MLAIRSRASSARQPEQPGQSFCNAVADAVSNTASGTAVGAPASSTPADQVAKKAGADASKPVFKAKKRQVFYAGHHSEVCGPGALSTINSWEAHCSAVRLVYRVCQKPLMQTVRKS